MTKATIELIDQLCDIIDKSKYLILSGTMAVGKTYLANLIAERCREAKYNAQGIYNKSGEYEIETELISIHPSFYYEDFVNGITIDTESGNINFHYADKVFLTMLKKANKSWEKKEDKKYFLILDDISRGAISGILGDMLPLIEPHGLNVYRTVLSSGETISVSPNVYIIATRSTIIDSVEQMNYGFLRHFYEFQLRNDYKKISRLDLNNIKTTGIYVYYKPVINAAKMVLSEITLEATGNSAITSYVVPYAISMDKLFEMYVRAYLKKAGIGSYDSKEPGIKLSQYDDKTAVLRERTKAYSKYIAGNIKPDIIIYNDENDNYLVFDVKYKNPLNSRSSRPDRLQILAYALMLNCKNVGNIFPTQDGTSNTYFKRNEINSREEKTRYYNQINVAIDTEWEFTIQEEGGTSMTTILEYCKRLLV